MSRADELLTNLIAAWDEDRGIVCAVKAARAYLNEKQPNNAPTSAAVSGLAPNQQTAQPVAWMYESEHSCAGPFIERRVVFTLDRYSAVPAKHIETPLYAAHSVQPPSESLRCKRCGYEAVAQCWHCECPDAYISTAVQPIPRDATEVMIKAMWFAALGYELDDLNCSSAETMAKQWRAGHDAFTKSTERDKAHFDQFGEHKPWPHDQPKSTEP